MEAKDFRETLERAKGRVSVEDLKDLENRFAHHAPKDQTVADSHSYMRNQCFGLAVYIYMNVPNCRERSLAITNLEQVMMWSNAAIARKS